jgi:hypothetical protein
VFGGFLVARWLPTAVDDWRIETWHRRDETIEATRRCGGRPTSAGASGIRSDSPSFGGLFQT